MAVKTRAFLLVAVLVTIGAREIPQLQQLIELQDEKAMHPGVTRRTREVRYDPQEDEPVKLPQSSKPFENPNHKKPAPSGAIMYSKDDQHYVDEGGGLFSPMLHLPPPPVSVEECQILFARQPKVNQVARRVGRHNRKGQHYLKPWERIRPHHGAIEEEPAFWRDGAQNTLKKHLAERHIENQAKNVILFLGDGMSIPTLAAARMLMGQKENKDGEESQLSFEKFPYTGLSKTYCVDTQVADSACSATAYLTGVKNNEGTIGVTSKVKKGDCAAMNEDSNKLESIVSWAQKAGKRTGIVTTTRVTHASPAGTYAHTAHRDWESDHNVVEDGEDPHVCIDIARQLVNQAPGKDLNVILGGGRSEFRSNAILDEEGTRGYRMDRLDLIKQWEEDQKTQLRNAKYVWNKEDLLAVSADDTDYLLGLFEGDHTRYNMDRDEAVDPTLRDMTMKAIEVLRKSDKGYFLFVEGGRIDHAHHNTLAQKALDETIQLSLAVEAAVNMTNEKDTLIVVTSDHAHTMSIAGYPDRGSNILGVYGMSGMDKKPFSTLSYSNGPGYKIGHDGSRYNMSDDDTYDKDYAFPSMVPLSSETHGGDDVAVFARGPWAHLFTGMYEQNVIPHVMAYASCIGLGEKYCDPPIKGRQWRP